MATSVIPYRKTSITGCKKINVPNGDTPTALVINFNKSFRYPVFIYSVRTMLNVGKYVKAAVINVSSNRAELQIWNTEPNWPVDVYIDWIADEMNVDETT